MGNLVSSKHIHESNRNSSFITDSDTSKASCDELRQSAFTANQHQMTSNKDTLKKRFRKPKVSNPVTSKHEIHLEFDLETSTYVGLDQAVRSFYQERESKMNNGSLDSKVAENGASAERTRRIKRFCRSLWSREKSEVSTVGAFTRFRNRKTAPIVGPPTSFQHELNISLNSNNLDFRLLSYIAKDNQGPLSASELRESELHADLKKEAESVTAIDDAFLTWTVDNFLVPEFTKANPFRIFDDAVKISDRSSGGVYRAWDPNRLIPVAIKGILLGKDGDEKQVTFEIAMMNSIVHPNIIKCFDSYKCGNSMYTVMELGDAGSLNEIVHSLNIKTTHLDEPEIAYICREVLQGLEALHNLKRIHHEIKSTNILLTRDGQVKIADFGRAAQLSVEFEKRNSFFSTSCWMAPEIILDLLHDAKVDIWSLGVLAIECAEGSLPYFDETRDDAMFYISTNGPPKLSDPRKWTSEFDDFVKKCTLIDASERSSASALLNHPFLLHASDKDHVSDLFSACSLFHERTMSESSYIAKLRAQGSHNG